MSNKFLKMFTLIVLLAMILSISTSFATVPEPNLPGGFNGLECLSNHMCIYIISKCPGGESTFYGVYNNGNGDCWGLSDYVAYYLASHGYACAIVEGPTSASSNHHAVRVLMNEDGQVHNFEAQRGTERGGKNYDYNWFTGSTHVIKRFNGYPY